jgi:hypothetical protein
MARFRRSTVWRAGGPPPPVRSYRVRRAYVFWGKEGQVAVELSRQHGGRTWKIFISDRPGERPM